MPQLGPDPMTDKFDIIIGAGPTDVFAVAGFPPIPGKELVRTPPSRRAEVLGCPMTGTDGASPPHSLRVLLLPYLV